MHYLFAAESMVDSVMLCIVSGYIGETGLSPCSCTNSGARCYAPDDAVTI